MRKAGPTQQLLQLCRLLPDFGYRAHVLTLSPEPPNDSMSAQFRDAQVTFHSLGLSRLQGSFLLNARVRDLVSHLRPHVIHSQGLRSDIVADEVHGSIPHVLTVRNVAWEDYPSMFGRLRGSIMAWRHTRLIRSARYPIACSRSLARALSNVRKDMTAIQNGVDTAIYLPAPAAEKHSLRYALHLAEVQSILLHVGSLIPRKRPDVLLQSFLSSQLGASATLVFVGDGPLREPLQRIANGRPNVVFTGAVANVVDYLRSADLLISFSASEGLPNSVLEALACGLPVVLSDIEPHVEIGAHTCGAGLILESHSPATLAAAVLDLLGRDRMALAESARALAETRFSGRTMTQQYATMYDVLIKAAT